MINREYIYTLYCADARAVLEYIEKLDTRIEQAQAQVQHTQQATIDLLSKELSIAKHLAENQKRELIELHQSNNLLTNRIHELERELTREAGKDVKPS